MSLQKNMRGAESVISLFFVFSEDQGCMGVGRGGRGSPWIFIHDNTIDRGLIVLFSVFLLFFGLFSVAPLPGRGLIVLFFGIFFVATTLEIILLTPLQGSCSNMIFEQPQTLCLKYSFVRILVKGPIRLLQWQRGFINSDSIFNRIS